MRNGSLFGRNKSDVESSLYRIGIKDLKSGDFVVKCGKTKNLGERIWRYKHMDYKLVKGFYYSDFEDVISKLESQVHYEQNFTKYLMDQRYHNGNSNGYTEWYQPTELYKIKSFIESQGYTLTEIKL